MSGLQALPPVRQIARAHDLELVHVDQLFTCGGSNRYWLSKNPAPDEFVLETMQGEGEAGLLDPAASNASSVESLAASEGSSNWFLKRRQDGAVIAGYVVTHKGGASMRVVRDSAGTFVYIVDANPEKRKRLMPGSNARVITHDELASVGSSRVPMLLWSIEPNLPQRIRRFTADTRIQFAHPAMREI